MLESAGLPSRPKLSTNMYTAKYWATRHKAGLQFERPDGTIGVDKTAGFHSRPGTKQTIRQANRAQNKKARQTLKRQLDAQKDDLDH